MTTQLTPTEASALEQLRKQQRRWRIARWIRLIGGSALTIAQFRYLPWFLMKVLPWIGAAQSPPMGPFRIVVTLYGAYLPFLSGLIAAFGGFLAITAIVHWNGSPSRVLLLVIADRVLGQESATPVERSP